VSRAWPAQAAERARRLDCEGAASGCPLISRPEFSPHSGMLPDLADALARLPVGQIGQFEPIFGQLEQMRLVGRARRPASKFQGRYGVSSVFVFFSDHRAHSCQQRTHRHRRKRDSWAMRSRNLEKTCRPAGDATSPRGAHGTAIPTPFAVSRLMIRFNLAVRSYLERSNQGASGSCAARRRDGRMCVAERLHPRFFASSRKIAGRF